MYSSKGAKLYTYVNKLNQTARIYSMALAFNNPQVKINSFDPKLWPFCRKYEINVNKVAANIDLKTTLQAGVLDAFFLMGIFKVRMADAGFVETEDNVWVDPGKPWVDRISPDDAILDMTAKDIRAMRFCGDRYRCSFDAVMDRDDFDKAVKNKMVASSKASYASGSERASNIANGSAVDDDELEPMVWLQDIYLPGTKQLATFCADNEDLPPLKVDEDDAGPMGAYEFLSLGMVPDNIIPSSPSQNLIGLHQLKNRLFRKLSQQAAIQKNVWAYAAGAEDDANRHKNSKNGEYVMMRDPKSVVPMDTPGVDGNTNAFSIALDETYNVQAGNEQAIAGLGMEADTLGQEQILQNRVNGMIAHMKGAVNDCASNICRKIGALMWDDDALTVDSSMEAEHTGYYVDSSWRPGEREGLKNHYDFSVEPNSMAYQPPEAKLQGIFDFLNRIAPIYPIVQAGLVDLQELTKIVAEYRNQPEIMRVFKNMQQQMGVEGGGDPHQATKAPVTSREVVRRDRGNPQGAQGAGLAAVIGQMMQGRGNGQQRPAMAGGGR